MKILDLLSEYANFSIEKCRTYFFAAQFKSRGNEKKNNWDDG